MKFVIVESTKPLGNYLVLINNQPLFTVGLYHTTKDDVKTDIENIVNKILNPNLDVVVEKSLKTQLTRKYNIDKISNLLNKAGIKLTDDIKVSCENLPNNALLHYSEDAHLPCVSNNTSKDRFNSREYVQTIHGIKVDNCTIHHINKDETDNSKENLVIIGSNSTLTPTSNRRIQDAVNKIFDNFVDTNSVLSGDTQSLDVPVMLFDKNGDELHRYVTITVHS